MPRHEHPYRHEPRVPEKVWRSASLRNVEVEPHLTRAQRDLVFLFLRRYATWCIRTGRQAKADGARDLYHRIARTLLAPDEEVERPLPSWRHHMRSYEDPPKRSR